MADKAVERSSQPVKIKSEAVKVSSEADKKTGELPDCVGIRIFQPCASSARLKKSLQSLF